MPVRELTDYHKRLLRLNRGIAHCRQVTLTIPKVQGFPSQIKFDDQADIRYARILGMEVVTLEDETLSIPLSGTLVSHRELPFFALTLETNDGDLITDSIGMESGRFRSTNQNIHWQPLVTLHRAIGYGAAGVKQLGVRSIFEFNNLFVTWQKSFVTVTSNAPVAGPGSILGKDICFNVYYTYRSVTGGLILK